jgi:transposase
MLDQSLRTAILELHKKGNGLRAIARTMRISRGAVREVVRAQSSDVPRLTRVEKATPHETDIRDLYMQCKGNLIRVHEELVQKGARFSYQALTGFCRRHGIGHEPKKPAGHYHFDPGQEMQHDTSPHRAHIGGHEQGVQTASLVLCYSRMRFIQLYPTFNRFICKIFLTDALEYFGGACKACMIDNTHVVVLKGTGKEMVPVPEMAAFSERYGFTFIAHEKGDANRSAHVERGFDHVERNFLAGRKFSDFNHANQEARAWCDKINASFRRDLHQSSVSLFASEKNCLEKLPLWVPEVYLLHHRIIDTEGYIHINGHIYSVPYQLIGRSVEARETKTKLYVFQGPRKVAEHERVFSGGKRRVTSPEHRPERREAVPRVPSPEEKELLSALPEELIGYVATVKKKGGSRWPVVLRRLLQMRREYPLPAFTEAVRVALHYGLFDLDRLERIVLRNIADEYFVLSENNDEEPDER